eukprot:snap_masked-scaffold_56-processed-gene-0.28-mRNA-1 protein AED:1.00 eAED:1.00 QI:0/0/0/0/1/1/3/0/98
MKEKKSEAKLETIKLNMVKKVVTEFWFPLIRNAREKEILRKWFTLPDTDENICNTGIRNSSFEKSNVFCLNLLEQFFLLYQNKKIRLIPQDFAVTSYF